MPAVPRIQRSVPHGPVTAARQPIEVIATIRWHGGDTTDEDAVAVAWTRTEVEVRWTDPWGGEHTDWIDAVDVRRLGQAAAPSAESRAERPPRSNGRRQRW